MFETLWRKWLARSAVNRKADGSSPPRGGMLTMSWFLMFRMIAISFHQLILCFKFRIGGNLLRAMVV